jgi:aspartyl/glutamyl-tRNA(asn/gln) amidotransferase subunit B
MRALDVSDVRMEQGSLRCDANVSLTPKGSAELGIRTETKNVNSLRSVERAVTFEMRRQAAILSDGGRVVQETRHFHEADGSTSPGRSKEEAQDYRYFAEPDLVPVAPSPEWIEELRATLPEPPAERRRRLSAEWDVDARTMASVVAAGALDLIEATVAAGASPQSARKWWLSELARRANEAGCELDALGVTPADVAETQAMVDAGELTDKLARAVFDGVIAGEGRPSDVVAERGLKVVSDDGALNTAVEEVIAVNPDVAQKIRDGKHQAVGALIGQVMKTMKGRADAARVRELLMDHLT